MSNLDVPFLDTDPNLSVQDILACVLHVWKQTYPMRRPYADPGEMSDKRIADTLASQPGGPSPTGPLRKFMRDLNDVMQAGTGFRLNVGDGLLVGYVDTDMTWAEFAEKHFPDRYLA
jgi:hypothetical protein